MKITIIENVGHGKKSVANWSYRVHHISDRNGITAVHDTFDGLTRATRELKACGYEVERLSSPTCSQMGVRSIQKLEDVEEYAKALCENDKYL